MKTYFLLVVASMLVLTSSAQTPDPYPWCPPGATWVYRSFSQSSNEFYVFSYVGDTTIQGKIAKKLDVGRVVYLGDFGELRSEVPHVGMEYLYNSNDSIFFLDNGTFNFMYRFNAQLNDTITLSNSRAGCSGDPNFPTSGQVVVDTIVQSTYGAYQFNEYWTIALGGYYIGSIVQNIGNLTSPFPQILQDTNFGCNFPFTEYGSNYVGLVCYSDNLRGELSISNSGYTCRDIKTTLEINLSLISQILLYPNPVSETLFIKGLPAQATSYRIFNLNGQLIQKGEIHTDASVEVTSLSDGMYFLSLSTKSGVNHFSKFLKRQP